MLIVVEKKLAIISQSCMRLTHGQHKVLSTQL